MQNLNDKLIAFCQKYDFACETEQINKLALYLNQLEKWNRNMNLVGYKNIEDILNYLIVDSFYLNKILQANNFNSEAQIWDLGAGAGLPGIPLRILWGVGNYYLVEAREKRALFMSSILAQLKLTKTYVVKDRAENFMLNKKADLILSRAFMPPEKLVDFVADFLNNNGQLIMLNNEALSSFNYFKLEKTIEYNVKNEKRFFNIFTKE